VIHRERGGDHGAAGAPAARSASGWFGSCKCSPAGRELVRPTGSQRRRRARTRRAPPHRGQGRGAATRSARGQVRPRRNVPRWLPGVARPLRGHPYFRRDDRGHPDLRPLGLCKGRVGIEAGEGDCFAGTVGARGSTDATVPQRRATPSSVFSSRATWRCSEHRCPVAIDGRQPRPLAGVAVPCDER